MTQPSLTNTPRHIELTAAGKPLVKLADMKTMKLKVWVSGAQLAEVMIGATCTVRIDDGVKGFQNLYRNYNPRI